MNDIYRKSNSNKFKIELNSDLELFKCLSCFIFTFIYAFNVSSFYFIFIYL